MTKIIYNAHPVTREFIGESDADESPKEPGVYLRPAHSSWHPSPSVDPHHVAVLLDDDKQWLVKPDWRGMTLYSTVDGSVITIDEIGITPQVLSATEQPRPSTAHKFTNGDWIIDNDLKDQVLDSIKAAQWEKIKTLRELRAGSGFKVGDKWFHSDSMSRIKQLGLVLLGANIPANTQWKTMDGTFALMTEALAGQIFQSAAASDMAIFAKAEQHKAAMEASTDPAAYDFTTGWQPVFGE